MAILKNFLLEMFREPQGDMIYLAGVEQKPDFTADVTAEITTRKEKTEKVTDEALKREIKAAFLAIDAKFEEIKPKGITEDEKEEIDSMIRTQIDERLRLMEDHLQPNTRVLHYTEVAGEFLEDIANDHNMDYDKLTTVFNKEGPEFHIKTYSGNDETKKGKHYCLKGDRVIVTLTGSETKSKEAEEQRVGDDLTRDLRAEDTTLKETHERKSATQTDQLRTAALEKVGRRGNLEELGRAKWRIPKRLNEKNWESFDTTGEGLTKQDNIRDVQQIISSEPFGWNMNQFIDVLNRGMNRTLRFDDLIRFAPKRIPGISETSGEDFMKRTIKLRGHKTENQKNLEDSISRADKFTKTTIDNKQKESLGTELSTELETAFTRQTNEPSPIWKNRVDSLATSISKRTKKAGIAEAELEQLRLALLLCNSTSRVISSYQAPIDKAQAEIMELEKYEEVLLASLELFDALSRLEEGEKQVDVDTSLTISRESYKTDAEKQAFDLVQEVFSGKDLETTQTSLTEGTDSKGHRGLTPLTQRYSLQVATDDVLQKYITGFGENGDKAELNAEGIQQYMKTLFLDGLHNYDLDSTNLDLVDLAKDMGTTTNPMDENLKILKKELDKAVKGNDKQKISKLNEGIRLNNTALIARIEYKFKTIKQLKPENITDKMRYVIHLGYLHQRTIELGKQRYEAKKDTLSAYISGPNGKMVGAMMKDIMTSVDLTPEQTREIAASISEQLQREITLPDAQTIEKAIRESYEERPGTDIRKITIAGLTLVYNPADGIENIIPTLFIDLTKWNLGIIDLSYSYKPGAPITLKAFIVGWTPGSWDVIDTEKFDFTVTPHASILGLSLNGTAKLGKEGKLQLGVGGGASVTWGGLVSGHGGVSLEDDAKASVETNINERIRASELESIPNPKTDSREATLEKLRDLPQMQETIRALNGIPQEKQDEILLMEYALLKEQTTFAGTDEWICPIRGITIGFIQPDAILEILFPYLNGAAKEKVRQVLNKLPFGIPVVFVKFAIGGAQVVPFITDENQLVNLIEQQDPEIARQTEQALNKRRDSLMSGEITKVVAESGRVQIDPQTGKLELAERSLAINLGTDLSEYNREFKKVGITLKKDEKVDKRYRDRAFRLQFAEGYPWGQVEIHMDGQTNPPTHLIRGNPKNTEERSTLEDIYLAFDQIDGNLYMDVRTVNGSFGDKDHPYGTKTVITIRTNPFRERSEITRDEASYFIGSATESVRETKIKPGAKYDSILSWEELKSNISAEHREEILETMTPEEYSAKIAQSHERIVNAINGRRKSTAERLTDTDLSTFASEHLPEISKKFKNFSTIQIDEDGNLQGADLPRLIEAIQGKAQTELNRTLSKDELNYLTNRMVVESFHKNASPEALKATIERFFRPQLKKMFLATETIKTIQPKEKAKETAEHFANIILETINYNLLLQKIRDGQSLDTIISTAGDIPQGASMLALVGTEGRSGFRELRNMNRNMLNDVLNSAKIVERIDTDKQATFRKMTLEIHSKVPGIEQGRAEAQEFLSCPLAIKFAELAPILLGPDASDKLAYLYATNEPEFSTLLAKPEYQQVYDKFRQLVDEFRNVQIKGGKVKIWTNMDKYKFAITNTSDYWSGIYRKCANPGIIPYEGFVIQPIGKPSVQVARALQEVNMGSKRNIYESYLGLAEYTMGEEEKNESKNGGNDSTRNGDIDGSDDRDGQNGDDPGDLSEGH